MVLKFFVRFAILLSQYAKLFKRIHGIKVCGGWLASELHISSMKRVFRKYGSGMLFRKGSCELLAEALERVAAKLVKEALEIAVLSGRKTIMRNDVEFAIRKVLKGKGVI